MKPHFGQSDAAMNKLAGCNSFPNAGNTFDLAELEQKACESGYETPYAMMSAQNEPLPRGYYGHEDGCDCAVCENMQLRELYLKRKAADLKAIKLLAFKEGADAFRRRIEAWLNDTFEYENSTLTVHRVREALLATTAEVSRAL